LIDFGVILRSKIQILQAKARRKMRKCIVVGQFGSIAVRLALEMDPQKLPGRGSAAVTNVCACEQHQTY